MQLSKNGHVFPSICDGGVGKPRVTRVLPMDLQVQRFVGGTPLQKFCRASKLENELFVTLVIGTTTYTCVGDFCYDNIQIVTDPQYLWKLYKGTKRIHDKKSGQTRCHYLVTYHLTKKGDYWKAEMIGDNDVELSKSKVKNAFARWAQIKNYRLDGDVKLCELETSINGQSFDTKAWVQNLHDARGKFRRLFCIMDSGAIVESESDGYKLKPCGERFHTNFCEFVLIGPSEYERK